MIKIKSEIGKFYIGDPCYALNNYNYSIWGEKFDYKEGLCNINGIDFIAYSTEFGDGAYEGSDGFIYSVDSGTIAVIPMELVDLNINNLGKIVNAKEISVEYDNGDFEIQYEGNTLNISTSCN